MRRCRNGLTILCAGDLAQLHGHGEHGRGLLRLVGRQGLFFGFALGTNRGLKGETGSTPSRNVLDRSVANPTGFGLCWCSAFEREDDLSNFDLLAFFDFDVFHDAADGRRDFDYGFVGLEFHDRLAFGNFGAGRDHQTNEIALGNVFSEFGEPEFAGAGKLGCNRGGGSSSGRSGRWGGHCGRLFLRNRRGPGWWCCSRCLRGGLRRGFCVSSIDGKDDLADFDLVALFDLNFLDGSGDRRRHLDDGLVSFEFHDRLTGADGGSGRNHEAHEVALFDVFSQLGKFEFDHRVVPFLRT